MFVNCTEYVAFASEELDKGQILNHFQCACVRPNAKTKHPNRARYATCIGIRGSPVLQEAAEVGAAGHQDDESDEGLKYYRAELASVYNSFLRLILNDLLGLYRAIQKKMSD